MELLDLSDFLTTKAQAIDFSARLSSISDGIFETSFDLEKSLQEQFGTEKKDKFLSLLRKNNIPPGSNTALGNFIDKLQQTISSMPTATMTLAIEPETEILKAVSNWFLLNLKQHVLIDINVDPNIVAGAIISYQGKQLDASIKPVFNRTYTAVLAEKEEQAVSNTPGQSNVSAHQQ